MARKPKKAAAPEEVTPDETAKPETPEPPAPEPEAPDEAEEAAPLEDVVDEWVDVTLTAAPADPLPLYVHGVGRWELRVGKPYRLPAEAVSALRNSGATLKE
ncbi:MAG: hypothetical protein KDK24_10030 [Pseudooceanicola sp.]|nr:hypothetical protein [Pseudooceanicola sp.]